MGNAILILLVVCGVFIYCIKTAGEVDKDDEMF